MNKEPARPLPPLSYPPRYTYPHAVRWTIAGLTDKPALDGLGESASDLKIRRIVELYVRDRTHREQLKAWCRGQSDEGSFREACRLRGWNRDTAQRNVDRALGMVFMMMNFLDGGA